MFDFIKDYAIMILGVVIFSMGTTMFFGALSYESKITTLNLVPLLLFLTSNA